MPRAAVNPWAVAAGVLTLFLAASAAVALLPPHAQAGGLPRKKAAPLEGLSPLSASMRGQAAQAAAGAAPAAQAAHGQGLRGAVTAPRVFERTTAALLDAGEAVRTCLDLHGSCGGWAARGECEANPEFMGQECRKACKLCGGGGGGGARSRRKRGAS